MRTHLISKFRPLVLSDETGIRLHHPILPNQWQGEINCFVGPFSGKDVAEYFAGYASEFGQYESMSYRVFPKRDEWFLEIKAVTVPGASREMKV